METVKKGKRIQRNVAFYPTYKEWKQRVAASNLVKIFTFYPTYKEWKLFSDRSSLYPLPPFYPTYKEWKPSSMKPLSGFVFVFLSYL